MKALNTAIVALVVANLIWGAASPIFKYSLQNIPPFSLALLRFLGACLLMYPFIHKQLAWRDLLSWQIWSVGILGITINISFFFLALQRTASINVPVIASLSPIIILFGSVIFLREKAKLNVIAGIFLSFVGTILIIIEPLLKGGFDGELIGNLMLIISVLGSVGHTLILRKYVKSNNIIKYTFWSFFIGVLTFFPFMLWEFKNDSLWMANLDHRGWIGIIFGAVFSSALAYYCYNFALTKLPAFTVGMFTYMDPIVAIIIAVPLLGEKITLPFILGSILVFAGILIAEKRLPWHPVHKLLIKKESK